MRTPQADQFEQHLSHQLSKRLGAVPVLVPILRRLQVAEIVDRHCPGKEKVSQWMGGTVLEDTLAVCA